MLTASKKVIKGWAMYDWAFSVYNLVITTTFFPIYFTKATNRYFGSDTVTFLGLKMENSALYAYALAAAYLSVSVFYPILTSIADTRGNKKSFMRFFCYMGAGGCSLLYFFDGSNLWLGILCFMLASIGYAGGMVFYNAYLPEIAAPQDQDRISAKGFAYGYTGGVVLQIIGFVLVLMAKDDPFPALRLTFLLVGLWWAGFAQFSFAVLPGAPRAAGLQRTNTLTAGFAEIKKVYNELKGMPVLKRFLRGCFFYSMGVQTVMLAATLFGSQLLHLEDTKLIVTIVAIQLVAIPGAFLMSRLSARYGNIKVLMGVVLFWIVICVAAYQTANFAGRLDHYYKEIAALQLEKRWVAAKTGAAAASADALNGRLEGQLSKVKMELAAHQTAIEYSFYILALAVGLVMGGIQSLSRSTYSKLMPETKDTASYFSYFDLTEKIAIVIGMFSFGYIEDLTGSMKNSVLFLIFFFEIGLVWLYAALLKQNEVTALSKPAKD
jgi:UMF1 family MFS transporter